MPESGRPTFHICITCREGEGAQLYRALAAQGGGHAVDVREVTCMASCSHGCTAAISAPGKWSYLLGALSVAHAADLLAYADIYAAHPSGAVLPSRRPESLRQSVIARLPSVGIAA